MAFCSKIDIMEKYRAFLSLYFTSKFFKEKIRKIIVGTSIKNIKNEHLTNNILPIPKDYILSKFEKMISPIFDKQAKILKENQYLSSFRDFLLPMLMNGQVGFIENE